MKKIILVLAIFTLFLPTPISALDQPEITPNAVIFHEEVEPNDTFENPNPNYTFEYQQNTTWEGSGTYNKYLDFDFYKFTTDYLADFEITAYFQKDHHLSQFQGFLQISLYDSDRKLLQTSTTEKVGINYNQVIRRSALKPGVYYVVIDVVTDRYTYIDEKYNLSVRLGGDYVLESISMSELPHKSVYNIGEEFDPTGGVILAKYENGQIFIPLLKEHIQPYFSKLTGHQLMLVTLHDKTTSYDYYLNPYRDVIPRNSFYNEIAGAKDMGFVTGFEDGLFHHSERVTRAQAIVMIMRALDLPIKDLPSTFKDLPNNNWATDYIMTAKELGYITGYEDNTFRSNNPISRAELVVIIERAFKIEEVPNTFPHFWDLSNVHWAYWSILSLASNKIISGYTDGSFRPSNFATRGEFTKILMNAYEIYSLNILK